MYVIDCQGLNTAWTTPSNGGVDTNSSFSLFVQWDRGAGALPYPAHTEAAAFVGFKHAPDTVRYFAIVIVCMTLGFAEVKAQSAHGTLPTHGVLLQQLIRLKASCGVLLDNGGRKSAVCDSAIWNSAI